MVLHRLVCPPRKYMDANEQRADRKINEETFSVIYVTVQIITLVRRSHTLGGASRNTMVGRRLYYWQHP